MSRIFWILFLIAGTLSAQNRWERLGPPQAASIRQLIPDRNHAGLWFVIDEEAFFHTRLYRSTDAGAHWARSSVTDVTSVAVNPGTSEVYIIRNHSSSVFASRDGGVHFQKRSVTPAFFNKVIAGTQPGLLYAIGYLKKPDSSGLLVSNNDGTNWSDVKNLPSCGTACYYSFTDLMISPLDSRFLMASGGIFEAESDPPSRISDVSIISTDGGSKWATSNHKSYKFYVDPLFPDRAFAIGNSGLLQLTKQGFKPISTIPLVDLTGVPGNANLLVALRKCTGCPGYYQERGVAARLVISQDGGKTWSEDNNDLLHSLRILGVTPGQKLLAGTEGGGIVARDRSGKWTQSNTFLDPEITDVESSGNTAYVLSDNRWIMKSVTGGAEWQSQPVPSMQAIFADPQQPLHLIADSNEESIPMFYSLDGGFSWHPSGGLSEGKGDVAHVAFDPRNAGVIYLSLEPFVVIYRSTDAGKSFHPLPVRFADSTYNISRIFVDPASPQTLFFLTSNGVYKSVDGGKSARAVNAGLPCVRCAQTPYDILPLLQRDSYALLLSDGELLRSDNGGEQWNTIGKVPSLSARRLTALDPAGQHLIVLGENSVSSEGLFESTDGGNTWKDISEEFGKGNYVWDMTDGRKSPFFVSTDRGVFALRQ